MPPRPFPLPLSIGADLQHVPRIRSLISRPDSAAQNIQLIRFMKKFLTFQEQKTFWARFAPNSSSVGLRPADFAPGPAKVEAICKHLSGRWAAKEAVIKAFTWRKVSPLQVLILPILVPGTPTSTHHKPVFALVTDRPCASFWTSATWASRWNPARQEPFPEADPDAGGTAPELENLAKVDDGDDDSHIIRKEESKIRRFTLDPDQKFIPPYEQHPDMDGQIAKVSISHDGEYAYAVCIAAEEPMVGDVGGEAQARESR